MKNSNDNIGNPTRDLPTFSAVPQPTALPRAPPCDNEVHKINFEYLLVLVFESNISINFICLFNIMCVYFNDYRRWTRRLHIWREFLWRCHLKYAWFVNFRIILPNHMGWYSIAHGDSFLRLVVQVLLFTIFMIYCIFNMSVDYNRTPLIRINWDGELFGYAENTNNWIFLWK